MAWRSSGTNNDEMVDNLKRFGVIHSPAVEEAFRGVDRRFFVPKNLQSLAHTDQPLKEGNIHISAPHIYGSVVEALELSPLSSMSFLNLGCGTGYLSSLVAKILGPTSRHVGLDVHANVVEHCRNAIRDWREASDLELPLIDIIHGNALHIETDKGEAVTGFDRIYVGASVDRRKLPNIVKMLRLGGIFVGPVDDELVKVVRLSDSEGENNQSSTPVPRSIRGQPPSLSSDYLMQVISSVRFTPLLNSPELHTLIPSQIWDPSIHQHFPESFRRSCKEIFLCSRASTYQPPPQQVTVARTNAAAKLPRALWIEILSYTDRTWFEKPRPADDSLLRRRLMEEQASARRAQEARLQAESRLHLVERERDVYRLLALRWQSRLQGIMRERGTVQDDDAMVGLEDFAEVARSAFANEPLLLRLGSLSALMRQFQRESDNDEEVYPDGADSESDNMDEEELDEEDAAESDEAMSVAAENSTAVNLSRSAQAVSITRSDT
ncbi:hypothetical protein ACA910_012985 [Epithemia clementina (nom. ined.)]